MSRLAEAEYRLEQAMQRLERAADAAVASGNSTRGELAAALAERDKVKSQANDLAQRLDDAVARLKATMTETA